MNTYMTVLAAVFVALGLINYESYREALKVSAWATVTFVAGAMLSAFGVAGYFLAQAVNG